MEVLCERCCGLDVHQKSVVACLLTPDAQGRKQRETRTFGTMTAELLQLSDWLQETGCTHVAMESTGVYWKPIYNPLEGQFELLVVNARHLRTVPGRKTDVSDAEWIAELLQHGLLRASFIPPAPQRELRELTRYRTRLGQERVRVSNQLQKVLASANIKLATVASDVLGVSGKAMVTALAAGREDPQELAQLARGQLQQKHAALVQALTGAVRAHHRFLLREHLAHIAYLEEAIERVSAEIAERLRPFEEALAHLDSIPGVNRRTAEVLLAEVGSGMRPFPDAHHLASWAGMCPGNDESAGKRRSGKTRKGSPWLKAALVESAHAATHTKETYLRAQYEHLVRRRGRAKAEVAVGHSIPVIAYHLLTRHEDYRELGSSYYDERQRDRTLRRLVARIEHLDLQVTLTPLAQAA